MALFIKPQFNTVWSQTGIKITPDVSKISTGWVVEIPPYEFDNWIQNRQDALLAHLNQVGIPMWDATVEYQAGKSYVQGTTSGVVYRANTTNTNVNPELDIQNNWSVAFQATGDALLKAQNLADVPNKTLARNNLGIPDTTFYDSRYLQQVNNLSDIPNKATARNNLGLGSSSTLNVGSIANTVASGDDVRIVNSVPNSRTITAGSGLFGGGNLTQDRTISVGTPSTITRTSTNSVSGNTHYHALDVESFINIVGVGAENLVGKGGIGPIQFRWGNMPVGSAEEFVSVDFIEPFPNACLNLQITSSIASNASTATSWWQINSKNSTRFSAFRQKPQEETTPIGGEYFAIGY